MRRKNVSIAQIDNKKLTMWSPHLDSTVSQNVPDTGRSHKVYRENQGKRKVDLTARGKGLAGVKIQRGKFQRYALSPLLLGNTQADTY